jgi:biopolymer transport protein TolR
VLLIIFMVIQPTTPKGLDTVVPQPPKDKNHRNDRTIVVQVLNTGAVPTYKINEQTFPKDQMATELTKIFETRQEKIMFIKGDPDLNFGAIADVIGFGKQADVTNIGSLRRNQCHAVNRRAAGADHHLYGDWANASTWTP